MLDEDSGFPKRPGENQVEIRHRGSLLGPGHITQDRDLRRANPSWLIPPTSLWLSCGCCPVGVVLLVLWLLTSWMQNCYRVLLPWIVSLAARRWEEVMENKSVPLDGFSVAKLGSPADFTQAAEILSLSLQVLRRSKCNVFCHLSLCLIPHFLKSPGIFSAPYPHLSLPAPLPCLFIAPRCTCLVCFAHCCVRCVHRPLRHVNCLVSWFSLTLPFKKRPKISATNPKNWKNKPPQTRQAGKYTVDLSVLS